MDGFGRSGKEEVEMALWKGVGIPYPGKNGVSHVRGSPIFVIILGLLILTMAPLSLGGNDHPADDVDIHTTSRDPLQEIMFKGPGDEGFINVMVQKERHVDSFHMELEGGMVGPIGVERNFTYTTNSPHLLHWGAIDQFPPKGGTASFQQNLAKSSDFGNLTFSDDTYVTHQININNSTKYNLSQYIYLYQQYSFILDLSGPQGDITSLPSLNLTWEGFGENLYRGNGYGVMLYIYNYSSSVWMMVDSPTDVTGSGDLKVFKTFNPEISADLIKDRRLVNLLVISPLYVPGDPSTDLIVSTDTISINVSWDYFSFPSDLRMDIGADGKNEWVHIGSLGLRADPIIIHDDPMVIEGFQTVIDGLGAGPGNASIPVRFLSSTAGTLAIRNLSIGYESLGFPSFKPLPMPLSFEEDTRADRLIDLWDLTTDEFGASNLNFSVFEVADASNVTVTLNLDGHHLDFEARENWGGSTYFRVKAENRFGKATVSPEMGITVFPVNDPPILYPVGDITVSEREHMHIQLNATDIEENILTFGDDTELFDVDPVSGTIDLTPGEGDDGTHNVTVWVSDGQYEVRESFNILVVEIDDPPVFERVPLYVEIMEDTTLDLKVKATDPEGKKVTYTIEPGTFGIDADTGTIHLAPHQEDVGIHNLVVRATAGMQSSELTFNVTVVEVNDPPVITGINITSVDGNGNLREGVGIHFEVELVDEEDAKGLEYEWRTDTDLLLSREASFVTNLSAGSHLVLLKVVDGGTTLERIASVYVEPVNPPGSHQGPSDPVPTHDGPEPEEERSQPDIKPAEAKAVALVLVFGGLGAALVIVTGTEVGKAGIFFFVTPLFTRIKKEAALDSFTRGKIFGAILSEPGISYNKLKKVTGVGNGTLAHHLKVLKQTDYIKFHRDGVYKNFFPRRMRLLKKQRNLSDVEKAIFRTIRERPGISQSKIAKHLSMSRQSINYQIKKLRREGFITFRRTGNRTGCFIRDEEDHE